jgi:glycosyltransferase involved in cell wall biosynthesis
MTSESKAATTVSVSVIVPAYNAADTIGETLASLIGQTYPLWNAIVVDDGSQDSTARVVKQFARRDPRIRLIRQSNRGESAARNAGITRATHDWLLFLDADDWIAPTYLERMTGAVSAKPLLEAVHCRYARVAGDGTEIVERYEPPEGDLFSVLARRAAFPVHACLVRTSLVREVGLFDTSLKTSADWDLWQRIARTGAVFGAVREVLAFYRMSPRSASLDAHQLFTDGRRVLRQGGLPDPRVPRPHPDHALGLAGENAKTQQFYLLSWCAGLLIGSGRDAISLLGLLGEDRFAEIWPPAVAQCLFESIPLPRRLPPARWDQLWPTVQQPVASFLEALQIQTSADSLAGHVEAHLKAMVVEAVPALSLVRDELRHAQRTSDARAAETTRIVEVVAELEARLTQLSERLDADRAARARAEEVLAHSAEERGRLEARLLQKIEHIQAQMSVLSERVETAEATRARAEQQLAQSRQEIRLLSELVQERNQALETQQEATSAVQSQLAVMAIRVRDLDDLLPRQQAALDRAARRQQHLEETIHWSQGEIDKYIGLVRESEQALQQYQAHAEAATANLAHRHAAELMDMRASAEWRVGDLLWNRAGLSAFGQPAARFVRRIRDRQTRRLLESRSAPRATKESTGQRRAVVAACWRFPIPSQTFVYQEVQGLARAGFDYQFFCCEAGPREDLPNAFEDAWARHVVVSSDWQINRRDYEHFATTRPERVNGLLDRLAGATGLTKDELLQQSIVLTGFTFARHAELYGAHYLHSYFFYDQSFMALMAAWLLQIPRGITAYADHVLDDYAFKLVPLQIELADVVVATSQRIKRELSTLCGGLFDDKILVKPNGIDTGRFPHVPAEQRLDGRPERDLISVSRIEPKKGILYLVHAMATLKSRGVSARLHIVGGVDPHTRTSAAYHQELVEQVQTLGLSDRIVLHGALQQAEFIPVMAQTHVFVAPYVEVASGDKDGVPTAVLEAMACGLPVVTTDAGSIEEAVTHDVQGLIVPQRDPVALADAIETLLRDRDRYLRLSDAARHRAVEDFDARVTERAFHARVRACLSTVARGEE